MELIPVITLALVAVLLVLVIILLARKPVQPPKTTDSGAISALGALVTQNLREGREAQDSRLAARTTTKSWTKCAALWTKSCKKHCPTA